MKNYLKIKPVATLFLLLILLAIASTLAFNANVVFADQNAYDAAVLKDNGANEVKAKAVKYIMDQKILFVYDDKSYEDASEVYILDENLPATWAGGSWNYVIDQSFINFRPVTLEKYFSGLQSITGLEYLNTTQTTRMTNMFQYCATSYLDLSKLDTSNVVYMNRMFSWPYSLGGLQEIVLSSFDTSKVEDMSEMFENCTRIVSLDLNNFNTSSVKSMNKMFYQCTNLKNLKIENFNTSNCSDMKELFCNCKSLTNFSIDSFRTNKLHDMSYMFKNCESIEKIDLSKFDTSLVHLDKQFELFCNCKSMQEVNLENFILRGHSYGIFNGCNDLQKIYVSPGTDWTTQVGDYYTLFDNCDNIIGGKGTRFITQYSLYAKVDGLNNKPGYFSVKPEHKAYINLNGGTFSYKPAGWEQDGSLYSKTFATGVSYIQIIDEWKNSGLSKSGYYLRTWDPYYGVLETDTVINAVWYEKVKCDVNDGTYLICSGLDNHKSVDVAGGSKVDCGNILLWSYNGGKNQQWEVKIDDNDGYATIKNVNSGKMLDVEGGSIRDGANVCQYHENGGDNQKWLIKKSKWGYTITSKVSRNYKVDLGGGSTTDGSNILMWHTNGGQNQDFYFFNLQPDVPTSDPSFKEGYYKIYSKNVPNMVADINGCSLANGANSIIWPEGSGKQNQVFHFIPQIVDGKTYYRIICMMSNKAYDAEGGCPLPGTHVIQWEQNGGLNQLWSVQKEGDYYTLVNVQTGLLLDVEGASKAAGTKNCLWTDNQGANQRWKLTSLNNIF